MIVLTMLSYDMPDHETYVADVQATALRVCDAWDALQPNNEIDVRARYTAMCEALEMLRGLVDPAMADAE